MDDQQLLTLRTTNAWLSLVAEVQPGYDPGAIGQFVAHCPLPVAVIDLVRGILTALSPSASVLLGLEHTEAEDVEVGVLAGDAELAGRLFALLTDGAIDAYEAHRGLRTANDTTLDANNWVAVTSVEDRTRALWAIIPRGECPSVHLPMPTSEVWPRAVAGLVMGMLDASWRIESLSPTVRDLVGISAEALRGQSFLDLLEPDDVAPTYSAVARALHDEAPVGVDLRLRRHSGGSRAATALLTPMEDPTFRIGIALTAAASVGDDDDGEHRARINNLERHLLRIAQEIEDSGVTSGFDAITDPRLVPGLHDLTGRQWDILRRLLRGERVPGISKALHLSQSAVRNHVSTLLGKAGVGSQEALISLIRAHPDDGERRRRPETRGPRQTLGARRFRAPSSGG